MTENQFQEARKIMKTANWIRGEITSAKGEVAKWTSIESAHRDNKRVAQAETAKRNLDKAMERLEKIRQRFAVLKFPEENAGAPTAWVAALCNDSYNYEPKEIPASKFDKAFKEGLNLYNTRHAAQSECDQLNSL